MTFFTEHLTVGSTLSGPQLAGSGLHIAEGEPTLDLPPQYLLSEGSIAVLDTREPRSVVDFEDDEEWRIAWDLVFADGEQHWSGEDWIVISDAPEIGEPVFIPDE